MGAAKSEDEEMGMGLLKTAIEIMPSSLLLNFYSAEREELKKQLDRVKVIFDKLIDILGRECQALQSRIDALNATARLKAANDRMNAATATTTSSTHQPFSDISYHEEHEEEEDDDDEGGRGSRAKMVVAEKDLELVREEERLGDTIDKFNLTWIQYMKFARRAEGIKAARLIFSRARKTPHCSRQVFIASGRRLFLHLIVSGSETFDFLIELRYTRVIWMGA